MDSWRRYDVGHYDNRDRLGTIDGAEFDHFISIRTRNCTPSHLPHIGTGGEPEIQEEPGCREFGIDIAWYCCYPAAVSS